MNQALYSDGSKVFQRLGHLVAFDVEMTGVQKVIAPGVGVKMSLTLGNLVVVVGELEVNSARVNVQMGSKHRA